MNDKVYIKINAPKGKPSPTPGRLKTTIENAVVKILKAIIPKANPDFEHLLDKVDHWKIEFDKTENAAWREIGFDKDGVSIVAMPLGDNYGFWTDHQLTLDDYENFDPTLITKEEFDNDWTDFEKKKNNACQQRLTKHAIRDTLVSRDHYIAKLKLTFSFWTNEI